MNKKILITFGTRPEAIKMASLVHVIKKTTDYDIKVCVTAQHREMLDQVLDFFEIVPDYDLNLMKSRQTLNSLSSRILNTFDKVLDDYKPDLVLVHGDTTTSSMCALASFHREIAVGHVEAGLRTNNKKSPFPEELNRQITGRIADIHFAPTKKSKDNLLLENIAENTIFVTGNTVIDSLYWTLNKLEDNYTNNVIEDLKNKIDFNKKNILITAHRRENQGKKMEIIFKALKKIAKTRKDTEIIFPVHLNPKVKDLAHDILKNISNVHLIQPLDYPSFVWIMKKSYLILSDSGGIQEEAPGLGIPVLVLRENTERPEAVSAGTVKLVGSDFDMIYNESIELLNNETAYHNMSSSKNPYGDGTANNKIINHIKEFLL